MPWRRERHRRSSILGYPCGQLAIQMREPTTIDADKTPGITYSSVRGVIFFSGSSSSAKFFLYFSQFSPVALGMVTGGYVARR